MTVPSPDRSHLQIVDGGAGSSFERRTSARQLGLWVFLASLAMLFAATVVGFLVIRYRTEGWSEGLPELPTGLLYSTVIILATSASLWGAVRAAARDEQIKLRGRLVVALTLAVAFLVAQSINWAQMIAEDMAPNTANLYAFTFYLLTGTHAVHVIGGFVPLAWSVYNARRGRYTSNDHEGLRLTAQYWHFLDVVWLLLLAVMWGTS